MFGVQAPSSFGAPASSAGLFGAPSSGGLFGAPAPSPGALFGATPQSSASLFGGAQSAASLFGSQPASSAGLFGAPAGGPGGLLGATSQSGLFGTSTPAAGGLFGAPASSGGLFAAPAASGGLFGAPASSGGLFGTPAASSGLFGAPAASGGLFGAPASSLGLFGAQQSSSGLFGAPASGGLFGATGGGGLFGATGGGGLFGAPASSQGLFGAQAGSPGMFGAVQAAPQQLQVDMGKDGRPITNETMFTDLPDHWQQAFKQVHGKVVEVRKDWRALKSSVGVLESVGPEQAHAELAAASRQLRSDLATAQKVLDLDSGAADAFHANIIALSGATQTAHDQLKVNVVRRDIERTKDEPQKQAKMMEHAHLFKSMPPLPAPFLGEAVHGFMVEAQRLRDMHAELAAIVPAGTLRARERTPAGISTLPDVLRSLHEYFVHVAARVSRVRSAMERMREAYLATQAAQGDFFDPFAEAGANEAMEAEARKRAPELQPAKPQARLQAAAAAAAAPQAGPTAPGTQLALTAAASSSSLLGGGFASVGNNRSNVKAKRR
eukprot:jgi/Ulvmu1/10374/UM061_0057.1